MGRRKPLLVGLLLLLLLGIVINVCFYHFYSSNSYEGRDISTISTPPRVLYCIAASSAQRFDVIERLLANAVDWCEGGYDVSIIVDTFDVTYEQHIDSLRVYCTRSTIPLSVVVHPKTSNLVTAHRKHFYNGLSSFDIFIYSEDDMSIRLHTLQRWQQETYLIKHCAENYMIGLLRFENALVALRTPSSKKLREEVPSLNALNQTLGMRNKVTWESNITKYYLLNRHSPEWVHGILPENYFISTQDTAYAAAYIFSSTQLRALESRCLFLSQQNLHLTPPFNTDSSRAFYSSLQTMHCSNLTVEGQSAPPGEGIYSPEFFCCMQFLFPIRHMESLLIHHIGTPGAYAENKWLNRHRRPLAMFLEDWYEWLEKQLDR